MPTSNPLYGIAVTRLMLLVSFFLAGFTWSAFFVLP